MESLHMATKKRGVRRKAKTSRKKAKPAKASNTKRSSKSVEPKKPLIVPAQIVVKTSHIEPSSVEIYKITIGNIRGDTAIGDLLVSFPRTREVLVRKGLRLEADDAGDIYMTLDAFCAMNDLKTESLVQDLVEVAKEPPAQQPVPQLATPPMT